MSYQKVKVPLPTVIVHMPTKIVGIPFGACAEDEIGIIDSKYNYSFLRSVSTIYGEESRFG